jgi:DNA polymerase III delta prime subunit
MGFMRKQMLTMQKASYDKTLQERLAILAKKGIESPKLDKDTIVRKLKADIKAVNRRLAAVAENEKTTEENAKRIAARAAAPKKSQGPAPAEKSKKGPEEGKVKKAKPEGGKSPKAAEPVGEPKTPEKA